MLCNIFPLKSRRLFVVVVHPVRYDWHNIIFELTKKQQHYNNVLQNERKTKAIAGIWSEDRIKMNRTETGNQSKMNWVIYGSIVAEMEAAGGLELIRIQSFHDDQIIEKEIEAVYTVHHSSMISSPFSRHPNDKSSYCTTTFKRHTELKPEIK